MYLNSEFEWEVLLVRRGTARCRPLKEGVAEEARHGRANLYPQKCNFLASLVHVKSPGERP